MPTTADTFFRYLPTSPQDKARGIYVMDAGYSKIAPRATYPPRGHPKGYDFSWEQGRILDEFQLILIARGGGVFESRSAGRKRIESGSVFMLFPKEWHRYRPHPATGWDEYWVGFGGDYATRLMRQSPVTPRQPVLVPREENSFFDLFTSFFAELRAARLGYAHILGATTGLMLAMLHASSLAKGRPDTHAETVIRQACLLLQDRAGLGLTDLARELKVGYSWLRRTFRTHTGLALHQYQLQLRLNQAMDLLNGSSLSIKEIASQTGFEDAFYFSRLFKKKTGLSPQRWRARILER